MTTLRFGVAVATLASLTASPAVAQQPVELWHAYSGAEEAALHEAARSFEEASGGRYRVRLLAVAFGAYLSKLEAAIPTGRGPDVFIDAHERLANYRRADLVEALPALSLVDLHVDERYLAPLRDEGTLYGVPLSLKCAALYVNTSLLPRPPPSLEALLAADLPAGTYPLVFEAENAYYVAALLHAYGGRLLDDDGSYGFVGPAAERTVETLRSMLRAGKLPQEANGELVGRLFASGRAAAAISGPWLAPQLEDVPWRVVPLPYVEDAGAPMRPYVTVEAAFVARGAGEGARELALFLTDARGARIRAVRGRQVVTQEQVWDDPEIGGDELLRTFRAAAEAGVVMPTHPHMRQVFEPAQRALRKALRTGEPIEEALRAGALTFADDTRPQPPPRDATPLMLGVGVLLLLVVLHWLRALRDPETRAALRRSLPAYRYLAHAFVAVFLLVVLPLAVGALTSLFAGHGRDLYYVGLANYVDILTARGGELLGHRSFYLTLLVTVLWTALNLLLHVAIGVALALLLNREKLRLRGVYRVLLIVPWAVPNYVTALAWKGMFHRQFGAVNAILETFGAEPVSWFSRWSTAFAANVATNVWLGFPFMMVVTLGALSAIPKELYEAAAVDGATAWQRFRHVTWPMVTPVLAPAVAMGAVWTFNMFNVVFLVSGGEPDGTTEILVSEAYRWAFTRGSQYGYAAAYAVLIFGVLWASTRVFGRRLTEVSA